MSILTQLSDRVQYYYMVLPPELRHLLEPSDAAANPAVAAILQQHPHLTLIPIDEHGVPIPPNPDGTYPPELFPAQATDVVQPPFDASDCITLSADEDLFEDLSATGPADYEYATRNCTIGATTVQEVVRVPKALH